MILHQGKCTVKRFLLCHPSEKSFPLRKQRAVRNHILTRIVCSTDDLLEIYAGSALINSCSLDLSCDSVKHTVRILFFSCFQCSGKLLHEIIRIPAVLHRMFFHIYKKTPAQKIAVPYCFICKLMRYQKFLLCSGPASNTD